MGGRQDQQAGLAACNAANWSAEPPVHGCKKRPEAAGLII